MKFDEWIREERRCGHKPGPQAVWNAALRHGVESANTATNPAMVPCKYHLYHGRKCRLGYTDPCGDTPCVLARHQ